MGVQRNGARTTLELLKKCCQLSHLPGFRLGLGRILGETEATTFYALWSPFCAAVELMIAGDDHFNRVDNLTPSYTGSEDTAII